MFNHQLFDQPAELETIFDSKGKHYVLPSGEIVDSVTTVLSKYYKKDLSGWRRRVGAEKAKQITTQAGIRGTAMHKICEQYVLNDPQYTKGTMSVNLAQFRTLQPVLDAHITKVYGVEFTLSSKAMNTAGTIDLVCEWDGVPTIVDYKTSLRIKKEEWLQSYFDQSTVYAIMATQCTKISFHQFAVIMIVDHEEPMVYKKSVFDYVKRVHEIFVGI